MIKLAHKRCGKIKWGGVNPLPQPTVPIPMQCIPILFGILYTMCTAATVKWQERKKVRTTRISYSYI